MLELCIAARGLKPATTYSAKSRCGANGNALTETGQHDKSGLIADRPGTITRQRSSEFQCAKVGRFAGESVGYAGQHRAGIDRCRPFRETKIKIFRTIETRRLAHCRRACLAED